MIRKEFIFAAVILLIAFTGITIVKYKGHQDHNGPLAAPAKPGSAQIFWTDYNRATEYRFQGKTDSSILAYQEALKLRPGHESALYYVGGMYMKADKFDKARETWEKLAELNPQSELAYNQLGNLYFCVKNTNYFHPEKSKWYFKRAKDLNKESLTPNLRLGEIALFQNKTNEAFDIFNKSSMMDQKNVEIFFIIGYLNWKSGKEQEALQDLKHTFKLVGTAVSTKKASVGNDQGYNLFMYWLTGNLTVPKKYDISVEMPKLYTKFDQYLIRVRAQLNHD